MRAARPLRANRVRPPPDAVARRHASTSMPNGMTVTRSRNGCERRGVLAERGRRHEEAPRRAIGGARERSVEELVLQRGRTTSLWNQMASGSRGRDGRIREQRPGIGLVQDHHVGVDLREVHRKRRRDGDRPGRAPGADPRDRHAVDLFAHRPPAGVERQHAALEAPLVAWQSDCTTRSMPPGTGG